MVTHEQWKPVREFPDDYEISSLGRLRRTSPSRGTRVGKILNPLRRNGYVAYTITMEQVRHNRYAHRLVVEAFLGVIPQGMQVNHKNGVKGDCRLENLEIVTNAENRAHSYRVLGVRPNRPAADKNVNAKLSWKIVDEIRASSEPASVIGKRLGLSRQGVWRVRTGQLWRDEDRPST